MVEARTALEKLQSHKVIRWREDLNWLEPETLQIVKLGAGLYTKIDITGLYDIEREPTEVNWRLLPSVNSRHCYLRCSSGSLW